MPPPLPDPSADLTPTPELTDPTYSELTVDANDYVSWTAMLAANPTVERFKIADGDFESWGTLVLDPASAGAPGRPRVIMYAGPMASSLPWNRVFEARLRGYQFGTPIGQAGATSYWTIHGLSFRDTVANPVENTIWFWSEHVVVDGNLIEDNHTQYGTRLRLWAKNNSIQRNLIQNPVTPGDGVGMQIQVFQTAAPGETMVGNRFVNNIVRNYNDSWQLTQGNIDNSDRCDGTIVDGNDFSIDNSLYSDGLGNLNGVGPYAFAENAVDIKGGSSSALSPVRISNNRIRGFRRTDPNGPSSGSDGAAINTHFWAKNIVVEDNVIWDCPAGIRELQWVEGDINRTRNTVYRRNTFHGIQQFAPEDKGCCYLTTLATTIEDSHHAHCTILQDTEFPVQSGDSTWSGNSLVDVPLGAATTAWNAGVGNQVITEQQTSSLLIWTDVIDSTPVLVTLTDAAIGAGTHSPGAVTTGSGGGSVVTSGGGGYVQ